MVFSGKFEEIQFSENSHQATWKLRSVDRPKNKTLGSPARYFQPSIARQVNYRSFDHNVHQQRHQAACASEHENEDVREAGAQDQTLDTKEKSLYQTSPDSA